MAILTKLDPKKSRVEKLTLSIDTASAQPSKEIWPLTIRLGTYSLSLTEDEIQQLKRWILDYEDRKHLGPNVYACGYREYTGEYGMFGGPCTLEEALGHAPSWDVELPAYILLLDSNKPEQSTPIYKWRNKRWRRLKVFAK